MRRRDFLKTATAAVGVSVLEGCRAETEEYLVQLPTRPGVLQGESIWTNTVCQQCAAGCGIQVRVVDGDAKKIEGNPGFPVNRGGVCALGHSLLQEIYNPDRILEPQASAGERGSGAFEPIGWEDALGRVVDAIGSVPGERLAFVGTDRAGLSGSLLRRFAGVLGAPPPSFLESPEFEVERAAAALALGVDEVPYFDIGRADYVLSIGAPILDRWHSPVHYTGRFADMRRGRVGRRGRFVQAEARMSLTAANADAWLPVRPGTEGLLARGIAGFLIAEGGATDEAAALYAQLFAEPTPGLGEVAAACDVSEERIRAVAEDLAAAENRVVVAGGSAAAHTNGLFNVTAALGLNLLLGNLGQPGGIFAPARFALGSAIEPEGDGDTPLATLAARLRGEGGQPVDVLVVSQADLLHALPGGWGLTDALAGVGTVIVMSSFADDTARHADVLLPLNTEPERFNAAEPGTSVGVPAIAIGAPVVEPMGEAYHPSDLILALAASLGGDVAAAFPWASFEALVRSRIDEEIASLPGGEGANATTYYFDALAQGGIMASGEPTGVPAGPTGPAPAASDGLFDGDAATFPFVLLPYETVHMGSGRGANRPWLQEMPDPMSTVMWNSWIDISPQDAEAMGLHDGDRVRVQSPAGVVEEVPVVIDPAVRPGIVGMPRGQGHTDYGRYASGRGTNPMILVGAAQVAGTSAPAWASTRVSMERVGEGPLARFGRGYEPSEEEGGAGGGEGEADETAAMAPQATDGEDLA